MNREPGTGNRSTSGRTAAFALLAGVLAGLPAAARAATIVLCDAHDDCPPGRFCESGACQQPPGVGDAAPLFGLGLPGLVAPRGGKEAELAATATETLKRLLAADGFFRVVAAPLTQGAGPVEAPTVTGFDAQGWHEAGAWALLMGALWSTRGGDLILEVRLFEIESGESVRLAFARQQVRPEDLRAALANVSNAVTEHYTGRPGLLGTRIAYARRLTSGAKEIYTVDVAGEDEQAVTTNGSLNVIPTWAPGGEIAYTSYRSGRPELWIGGRKLVAYAELATGAAFSPDGRVAAVTLSDEGNADIFLIDAATGRVVRQLTSEPGIDTSPTWSPDGQRLAFVSDRTGSPHIYVMKPDGSDLRELTPDGYNTNPCWSPRGDLIAYDRLLTAEHADLFVVDVASGAIRRLTHHPWSSEDPSFSPDGRQIVFVSKRDGDAQIHVISADGRAERRLSTGAGPYAAPNWSPRAARTAAQPAAPVTHAPR